MRGNVRLPQLPQFVKQGYRIHPRIEHLAVRLKNDFIRRANIERLLHAPALLRLLTWLGG